MRQSILLLFFLIGFLIIPLKSVNLKPIKEIGSEKEDYTFFRISGAVLAKNYDIYVSDFKGDFVARYTWKGEFVKKIGRPGQGPGDFSGPGLLNIFEDKIYLYDGRNGRIAEMDLNLHNLKYYKLHDGIPFFNNFYVMDHNKFIGNSYTNDDHNQKYFIKIIDIKSNAIASFFDHIPIKRRKKIGFDLNDGFSRRFFFNPKFAIDRENRKLLISFMYPDNPVEFYVYSLDGKCMDKFYYEMEAKYHFPYYFLERPLKYPSTSFYPMVSSVLFYKKYYIVFLALLQYKGKNFDSGEKLCLIFDSKDHSLKSEIPVNMDIEAFFISDEGYLLVRKYMEDIEKLYIYKLEI